MHSSNTTYGPVAVKSPSQMTYKESERLEEFFLKKKPKKEPTTPEEKLKWHREKAMKLFGQMKTGGDKNLKAEYDHHATETRKYHTMVRNSMVKNSMGESIEDGIRSVASFDDQRKRANNIKRERHKHARSTKDEKLARKNHAIKLQKLQHARVAEAQEGPDSMDKTQTKKDGSERSDRGDSFDAKKSLTAKSKNGIDRVEKLKPGPQDKIEINPQLSRPIN
jgi:hypothetical protein